MIFRGWFISHFTKLKAWWKSPFHLAKCSMRWVHHIRLLMSNLVHGKYITVWLKTSNYGSKHTETTWGHIFYISSALNFNYLKFLLQSIRESFLCKLLLRLFMRSFVNPICFMEKRILPIDNFMWERRLVNALFKTFLLHNFWITADYLRRLHYCASHVRLLQGDTRIRNSKMVVKRSIWMHVQMEVTLYL